MSDLEPILPSVDNSSNLHVVIQREPFGDYFHLTLDNGETEELEPEDTREWFKLRGANMDKIESVLDHVWNFYYAEVNIKNSKEPPRPNIPHAPHI